MVFYKTFTCCYHCSSSCGASSLDCSGSYILNVCTGYKNLPVVTTAVVPVVPCTPLVAELPVVCIAVVPTIITGLIIGLRLKSN